MTLHPIVCLLLSKVGIQPIYDQYESPGSLVTVWTCPRCQSYAVEAHGLNFVGRVRRFRKELPQISKILDLQGYSAASRELRQLESTLNELYPED